MKGNVKMFLSKKGYGFIHGEDGHDYFFHYSSILMEGFKTVNQGDQVEFEVQNEERGFKAINIKKI